MTDASVRIYLHDDPGFLAWRDSNDRAYVINTEGDRLRPGYLMLHLAKCSHLRHRNEGGEEHTMTGSYAKVCSTSREALDRWLRWSFGHEAEVTHCQDCRPE